MTSAVNDPAFAILADVEGQPAPMQRAGCATMSGPPRTDQLALAVIG